jgi:hypothetical protein
MVKGSEDVFGFMEIAGNLIILLKNYALII